jgi:hypothetical protein
MTGFSARMMSTKEEISDCRVFMHGVYYVIYNGVNIWNKAVFLVI